MSGLVLFRLLCLGVELRKVIYVFLYIWLVLKGKVVPRSLVEWLVGRDAGRDVITVMPLEYYFHRFDLWRPLKVAACFCT